MAILVERHRSNIQYSIPCKECGARAAYSPTEHTSGLLAVCEKCQRVAAAQEAKKKTREFKAAERWLIDSSQLRGKR